MRTILPIISAVVFLAGAAPVLASGVPELDIGPTCRGVLQLGPGLARDVEGCKASENAARDELKQKWDRYSGAQQGHCTRLSTLGGLPSYIELLTCLEIDEAAKNLPVRERTRIDRRNSNIETTGQADIDGGKAGSMINR